jgi:hypothetical protein
MKKSIVTATIAVLLFGSAQAWAWQGPNIYISPPALVINPAPPVVVVPAPPPPPPAVYVPAPPPPPPVVQYRYYPAYNVYWDPTSGLYWSMVNGGWVLGPLPSYIYPGSLGGFEIVAAPGRPWHYYHPHRHY